MTKRQLNPLRIGKGLLCLLALFMMLLTPQRAWAQDPVSYGLTVAGVEVTSENASNISDINFTGTITYDKDSHTLTLENATIDGYGCFIEWSYDDDLTIEFSGNNSVDNQNDDISKLSAIKSTKTGHNLILKKKDGAIDATLSLGSNLRGSTTADLSGVAIISGFSGVSATGLVSSENSGSFSLPNNGGDFTYKSITYAIPYNIQIGGTQVTSVNRKNVFEDGKVSYTPAEGSNPATLTLSGASINGPIEGSENLTVVLVGSNSITVQSGAAFISNAQANSPTLTFSSEHALSDVLNINCQCSEIKDIVSGYSIFNTFYNDQSSEDWAWGCLQDNDGVKIYKIKRYDLWLDSTQFTSEDLGACQSGDIFQFDPDNNMLTLSNVGQSYATSSIECNISDFKIQLNGVNYLKNINYTAPDQTSEGTLTIKKNASSQADENSLTLSNESGVITGFKTVTVESPLQVATPATLPEQWNSNTTSAVITDANGGLAPLTNLEVTIEGWTYGETAKTPTVTGNTGNGTTTFFYKVKDAADDTYVAYPGTQTLNAGDYTIKVEVAATANYAAGSATADFSISKATITEEQFTKPTVIDDVVYDGTAKELVNAGSVPDGATIEYLFAPISEEEFADLSDYRWNCIVEDDAYTYQTTVPTSTNAGYFAMVYRVKGGNNYEDIPASSTETFALWPATITNVTLNPTSLTYDGSDHTVSITVMAGSLQLGANDYTVTLNGEEVSTIKAKDTGSYTVEVTGKGNFTGTKSATFNIVNPTLVVNDGTFHNGWATYYNANEAFNLPEGVGAFVASGVNSGAVSVMQISSIPKGVPVLLSNVAANLSNTTEYVANTTPNLLKHADTAVEVDPEAGDYYGLYDGTFMRVKGTISAGKNYLLNPAAIQGGFAPQLTIVIDGETTGVNDVRSKKEDVRGDIYDLQGRKVKKPSKKGLYIQKGHKVVVNK